MALNVTSRPGGLETVTEGVVDALLAVNIAESWTDDGLLLAIFSIFDDSSFFAGFSCGIEKSCPSFSA